MSCSTPPPLGQTAAQWPGKATVVLDLQQIGARILCFQQVFRSCESLTRAGALEVGFRIATKGGSPADEHGLHQRRG